MKHSLKFLRVIVIATFALFCAQAASAQMSLAFGGNFSLEPQYWSKIGTSDDPKFGVGFAGMAGLGLSLDPSMRVLVGPRFAYSTWSADYSDKANSATQSVYVNMTDMGVAVYADFDDMWLQFGTGRSTIGSGMMVSGQDITYPYNGETYGYYNVAVGMKTGIFQFGVSYTSYTDYAQYCDRLGFILGLGL